MLVGGLGDVDVPTAHKVDFVGEPVLFNDPQQLPNGLLLKVKALLCLLDAKKDFAPAEALKGIRREMPAISA